MRLVISWSGYQCFLGSLITPNRFCDFGSFHDEGHNVNDLIETSVGPIGNGWEDTLEEVKQIRV